MKYFASCKTLDEQEDGKKRPGIETIKDIEKGKWER